MSDILEQVGDAVASVLPDSGPAKGKKKGKKVYKKKVYKGGDDSNGLLMVAAAGILAFAGYKYFTYQSPTSQTQAAVQSMETMPPQPNNNALTVGPQGNTYYNGTPDMWSG